MIRYQTTFTLPTSQGTFPAETFLDYWKNLDYKGPVTGLTTCTHWRNFTPNTGEGARLFVMQDEGSRYTGCHITLKRFHVNLYSRIEAEIKLPLETEVSMGMEVGGIWFPYSNRGRWIILDGKRKIPYKDDFHTYWIEFRKKWIVAGIDKKIVSWKKRTSYDKLLPSLFIIVPENRKAGDYDGTSMYVKSFKVLDNLPLKNLIRMLWAI